MAIQNLPPVPNTPLVEDPASDAIWKRWFDAARTRIINAVTFAAQSANTFFAGPTSGGSAAPTFRALVTADLPAGTGTVTSVSVAPANGFSGTVANATTTPAITIIAGAITPTSVNTTNGAISGGVFTGLADAIIHGNTVGLGAAGISTNIAFGQSVLSNASATGTENIGIGISALSALTGGNFNVAIGRSALTAVLGGSSNVAIGYQAAISITTGSSNIAIGNGSLKQVTTQSSAIAIGVNALTSSTGDENTGIGASAASSVTSGSYTTAVGSLALLLSTTSNFNTAFGRAALFQTTGGNNTGCGAGAGLSNTSGTNNTFIGDSANSASGALTYAAAIGAGATVSFSNTIVLGRSTETVSVPGLIAAGLSAATAILHLKAGTAAANTAPLKFNSGTLLTTAEAGAVEFLTDTYYGTITTGAARKTFAFLESPSFTTPNIGAATGTSLSVTGTIKPGGFTVATLPAGVTGAKAYVTDAVAPAFLTLLVGGGAAYSGAQYSGAAWVGD